MAELVFTALMVPLVLILGVWLLVTVIRRLLRGGPPKTDGMPCPICRRWTSACEPRCDWCGHEHDRAKSSELADLEATRRQLGRMQKAGAISGEEVDRLLARMDEYRESLKGTPSPTAPVQPQAAPPRPVEPEIVAAELVDEPPQPLPPPVGPPELPQRPAPAGPPRRKPAPPTRPATPAPPASKPPQAKTPEVKLPEEPAAATEVVEPSVPPEPAPPRRSWTEILGAFMEDRNIRIGELVGGLLFVVFSVLLTISLWEPLTKIPYYPFFILVAVSSAVFGAGLYAHHRWRLESTSLSLLVIATLLVPLNFFTMVGISKGDWDWISVAAELASLGIFAWLLYQSARVLVPRGPWHQVAAVLGNSAALLLLGRAVGAEAPAWQFMAASLVPVAFCAGSVGAYLVRVPERRSMKAPGAAALFVLLGTATFATLVPLGMLVAQASTADGLGVAVALDRLAVPAVILALPLLAAGLTVVRGTQRDRSLGPYRTAGTVVALLAVVLMLAALALAWPISQHMIVVSLLSTVALLVAAFRYRAAFLHAGVIAFGATFYLTGFHYIRNYSEIATQSRAELAQYMIERLLRALTGSGAAISGLALVGLCALLVVVGQWLFRGAWRRHGLIYFYGAAVVAALSLALVTLPGLSQGPDTLRAAIVYGIYGVALLAANSRFRNPAASYLGLGLVVAASLWTMRWSQGGIGPYWASLLAVDALAMILVAIAAIWTTEAQRPRPWAAELPAAVRSQLPTWDALIEAYRLPLVRVGEAVAILALAVGLWTVWRDRGAIFHMPAPVIATICLGAVYLLLAWAYRSAERSVAASLILLAGLVHTFVWNFDGWFEQPWLVALLTHATLAVAAAWALELLAGRRALAAQNRDLHRVLIGPLSQTALLSSVLVLPLLPLVWNPTSTTLSLAQCLFWLAGVWLVIAWTRRLAAMMAAHQAVLAVATAVATTAWLEHQTWYVPLATSPFAPHTLQAYGIVLGGLCLLWLVVRFFLRRNKRAAELLDGRFPTVDRVMFSALVVLQAALPALYLAQGSYLELLSPGTMSLAAFGPGAWGLLAVLAVTLCVGLWYRWRQEELIAAMLLAATVPCLVAGHLANDLAAASALRWGLGLLFVAGSVVVWQRRPLRRIARAVGAKVRLRRSGPPLARAALLFLAALPVLALTLTAALVQLVGLSPGRPDPNVYNVFFHRIDLNLSYLVPLAFVLIGLVGSAIRERSSGYAFGAGLVAQMAVVLGYALHVVTSGRSFGTAEVVTVVQLATITAGAWAGLWLVARRWLDVWREDGPRAAAATSAMQVQLGIALMGNLLLLVVALVRLAVFASNSGDWPVAAGRPLGWLALGLLVVAWAYRRFQLGRRLRPEMAGAAGMAVLGLLACTVQGLAPGWGYRTLMLGWAAYALFVVAATWWVATIRTLPGALGPPQALVRAASLWVALAGGAAVALGIKAAALHSSYEDLLWSAAAIAIAAGAGATMAYWRRAEGWAFTAALGVNLAASLVVWYFQFELPLEAWWLRLVQANVIATAAVALIWLVARRRLYALGEMSLRTSPLLGIQTALAVAGNAALLTLPVVRLLAAPQTLPAWAGQIATPAGWAALLLAVLAVAWYLRQTAPSAIFHAAGGAALALPVLLTCYTAEGRLPLHLGAWMSYHVLLTTVAIAGLLLLAAGMAVTRWTAARSRRSESSATETPDPATTLALPLNPTVLRAWIAALGIATVVLALLWSQQDLLGLWWRVRAILSVSLVAGLVAVWHRLPRYVFVSGLLVCVAGTLIWTAHGPDTLAALVQTNVLCLALGAALWTLIEPLHRNGVPTARLGDRPWPFAHAAALAALALTVVLAVAILVCLLVPIPIAPAAPVGKAAATALALAMLVLLWDRRARFPLAGLYALGPVAIVLIMHDRMRSPMLSFWTLSTEMPGVLLAAAATGWVLPRMKRLPGLLHIPNPPGRWPVRWFMVAQAVLTLACAVLVVWIALDFRFDPIGEKIARLGISGRLAAIIGALMILGITVVMGNHIVRHWDRAWHSAGFAAGLLLQCSIGWALLSAESAAPWLHRSVTLLVGSTMLTLLSSAGLSRFVPSANLWIKSGRRIAPYLGSLALLALVAVLVQEGFAYAEYGRAPLSDLETVVVAAALVGLVVACLAFAMVPGLDRLRLSPRGRTVYVYVAEVLVVLLCVHIRLARAEWFQLGIIRQYWMLIVMAVAFVGAGLSEWFHRRRMPVLSEPLEWTAFVLPLLPAVGFWLLPVKLAALGVAGRTPAVWFLMGLFYLVAAVQRRPAGRTLPTALAILAGNMGLWVLWNRLGIGIVDHPQLWLIPVGLCVLVAEALNHDRLTSAQSGAIRYMALALIYVSSTADMFITGIGQSVWLPLVLMLLCVAGVLLGIMLRVRSFLVLGITFLLVLVLTMVKYAAVDLEKIWILYACGVATATAIIALFAVFEKRRNDILEAAERFKRWDR